MINPAGVIVLPGHTAFRGQTHFAQADVIERRLRKADTKSLANSGRQVSHVSDLGWQVTVPVLLPFAALVPLLRTWAALSYGRAVAPGLVAIESINTTTEVGTATAHPFATADLVYPVWDEVAPTSVPALSKETPVYVRSASADTLTVHATANDATTNASPYNFSAAGVGMFALTKQFPLTVDRRSGVRRTYLNAVPTEFPTLKIAGGMLTWQGNLVFRCLPGIGKVPSDGDGAFWTEAPQAYAAPAWDASAALTTLPVSAAWGAAPFATMHSEAGWEVTLKPTLTEQHNSIWPVSTLRMTGFEASVKGKPLGITKPELEARMAEQLGAQFAGADFILTIADYVITLRNAQLLGEVDQPYSVQSSNIGDMVWTAHGNATSDIHPPFSIEDDN